MLAKLRRYVGEGRIEIPALFGNEITGLCGHEELIRLMYPSFRLGRDFGATIRSASITDVPGLSWGLPTVLAGAGVKYFFAGLPKYFGWGSTDSHSFWDEAAVLRNGRSDAFRWEGPDGRSVLVYYQGGYGCWIPSSYSQAVESLPGMLSALEEQGCPFSVLRFAGYGGWDNAPPDVRVSHIVREWNDRWAYPKLIVATNTMFFEKLEEQCGDVRVFRGELPHTDYAVGAASTAAETTVNRLTHDRLPAAEKLATVASVLVGSPYPAERIRGAYDNMLLYDEHTWGMAYPVGEMQDWNWADKSRYAYRAAALAQTVLRSSVRQIADHVSLSEDGEHVVVFNPLGFERTDVVRLPSFRASDPFDLIDVQSGAAIPHQIVEIDSPHAPMPYAADRYARGQFNPPERFDLVFVAEAVPPLGWKAYRMLPTSSLSTFTSSVSVDGTRLESRHFRVEIDPRTGAVESIRDKQLARQIVDPRAPHELNQLVVKWVETGELESTRNTHVREGQLGPVYGSLVATSQAPGCPRVTQEIIVYDELDRIDLANRVSRDSTPLMELYFAFPFRIENPSFRFEGSNSVIEPLVDQFPGSNSNYYTVQSWADVSGDRMGVTLSPIDSHLLEFGGLWPCYVSPAHHGLTPSDFGRDFVGPDELDKGHLYAFVHASNFCTNFPPLRPGDLLFRYSIGTHQGDWKAGNPHDFGWAATNPLVPVLLRGKREGTLDETMSFCSIEEPNVLLLCLKEAEDGRGIIVRLIETRGMATNATLRLPFVDIEKSFAANLVEEDEGPLPATPHTVTVPIGAFGIATIRVIPR